MVDAQRLREIDSQLAETEKKYHAAQLVFNEAGDEYQATCKTLWEEREHLICNLDDGDEWGSD